MNRCRAMHGSNGTFYLVFIGYKGPEKNTKPIFERVEKAAQFSCIRLNKSNPKLITTPRTILQPCKHFSWVSYHVRISGKIRNKIYRDRMMNKRFYLFTWLDTKKT